MGGRAEPESKGPLQADLASTQRVRACLTMRSARQSVSCVATPHPVLPPQGGKGRQSHPVGPRRLSLSNEARVPRGARLRRRRMAASRAGASGEDPGGRISAFGVARGECESTGGVPEGPQRAGFRRGRERRDRVPLGGRPGRSARGAGGRSDSSTGRGDRRGGRNGGGCRQEGDGRHSDRLRRRRRSRRPRPRREPGSPRGQRHGRRVAQRRPRREAAFSHP